MLALLTSRFTWIALAIVGAISYDGFLHWRISHLETFKTQAELIAENAVQENKAEAATRQSISDKVVQDYESRLAALNARIDRLQHSSPNPVPTIPASSPVPPSPPTVPDQVSSCGADYARVATQLEELQQWVTQQQNVPSATSSKTPLIP